MNRVTTNGPSRACLRLAKMRCTARREASTLFTRLKCYESSIHQNGREENHTWQDERTESIAAAFWAPP